MATTDTRTGFRLPWSTDRSASREASAEPAEELAPGAPTTDVDDGTTNAPDPVSTNPQDVAGDRALDQEDETVTILAPGTGHVQAHADPPAPAYEPAATPDPGSSDTSTLAGAPVAATTRRPAKFLADLTRAMQAAAEQARSATLEQFRADGTAVIEQIHSRSATGATELRRHADDDVATIKDWSKAEIARIRDETERRVGMRREQLEGQLERHAALVEHDVEKVRGLLAEFEAEMGRFFDSLVGEEDPGVFAARAANLPEPPQLDVLDDDAMAALLREPGIGVPEPTVEAAAEIVAGPDALLAPEPDTAAEASFDAPVTVVDAAPADDVAAMAAIQAAAEAATAYEAVETTTDAVAEPASEASFDAPASEAVLGDPTAYDLAPADEAPDDDAAALDAASDDEADAAPATFTAESEIDPRLAMLGLTPDFAAAEVAAVEMAAADVDEVPEIGGAALEARLSGLVPADEPVAEEATATTQVIVTGLVSVASIASFKRHLGRLPGVSHVGVSSGPDAEFIFAVSHESATPLRDLIPTVPGFAARITATGDGVIQVSAQDPQD